MSHSLSNIYVHLVFGTKERHCVIDPDDAHGMKAFAAGVLRNHGCEAIELEVLADHLHLLFVLSKTKSVSEVAREVKTATSRWLKTRKPKHRDFHWQNGYGAFSVSQSAVPSVVKYIRNQPAHHEQRSFGDEYIAMLDRVRMRTGG